ncbi:MAG: DUF3105 domain-containing protein [Caldilineaceae bacterium]
MSALRYLAIVFSLFLVAWGGFACGSAATATPTPQPVAVPATATEAPAATATLASTVTPAADTKPALADILVILGRAEGLEKFVEVAEQVGLTEMLAGAGPFTVLAPPTAAFDQLPAAVLANRDMMRAILQEHIIEGKYHLQEMIEPNTVTNLRGDALSIMLGQEGATVQGSNVLGGDFEANNGMIHLIDTVILPADLAADVMALYPTVVGEQTYPMQGNLHIAVAATSPVAYNSTPPTSGPHYPNIVAWQFYAEPFRYEQLVHNLEDAGVLIYYQCATACSELVQQLHDFAQPYIDGGRHIAVVPNDPTWTTPDGAKPHGDMGAPIAVTAWRKLLTLDAFDAAKISQFIDTYEGIDHHVR